LKKQTKISSIAKWLLEHRRFLDNLLFEAISVSRRLCHYEFDDEVVSGLDASFDVQFLSPIAKETKNSLLLEIVHLTFEISRHNPIVLKYESVLPDLKEESVELLSLMDCLHMEGDSYDDLETIRILVCNRLLTLSQGKSIENYGVLNVESPELFSARMKNLENEFNQNITQTLKPRGTKNAPRKKPLGNEPLRV
jgi:hypothetical protein